MEEIIASNVCRLCLWKTAPLIPIFGSNHLYEKIIQLVPISVHPGNGLSQFICGECLYKVELFNEFRSAALKCDRMQQDYRQIWDSHLLSEIDKVPWSSTHDGIGRFRQAPLPPIHIKTEPPSGDVSSLSTRPSELPKHSNKERWPAEVDHEEVMCMTIAPAKRRSTSLYSRAPCSESPGCPYICRYCKTELSTSAALAHHERKHIEYVCLICDEKLSDEGALRMHVRTICNISNVGNDDLGKEPDENFKCGTCSRIFRSSISLWRHCVCLFHYQQHGAARSQGTGISHRGRRSALQTGRPAGRPAGRPPGSISRGGRMMGGYGRGRGKNIVFGKRREWVYDKTSCDVCGRVFTSNCGMLIHRKHVHK